MKLGEIQQRCITAIETRRKLGLPDRGATLTLKKFGSCPRKGAVMLWGTRRRPGPYGEVIDTTPQGHGLVMIDACAVLAWINERVPRAHRREPAPTGAESEDRYGR